MTMTLGADRQGSLLGSHNARTSLMLQPIRGIHIDNSYQAQKQMTSTPSTKAWKWLGCRMNTAQSLLNPAGKTGMAVTPMHSLEKAGDATHARLVAWLRSELQHQHFNQVMAVINADGLQECYRQLFFDRHDCCDCVMLQPGKFGRC